MNKTIWIAAGAFILLMNLTAFGLMAYDKQCARRKKWRVPERNLFFAAACFGGLGGVLGMILLRHKTKHWYFRLFFPLFLLIQAALIGAAVYLSLKQ